MKTISNHMKTTTSAFSTQQLIMKMRPRCASRRTCIYMRTHQPALGVDVIHRAPTCVHMTVETYPAPAHALIQYTEDIFKVILYGFYMVFV